MTAQDFVVRCEKREINKNKRETKKNNGGKVALILCVLFASLRS